MNIFIPVSFSFNNDHLFSNAKKKLQLTMLLDLMTSKNKKKNDNMSIVTEDSLAFSKLMKER